MAERELNQRTTDYGLSVTLIWNDQTDSTYIEMESADDWRRFEISPADASAAFDHPFIFLAHAEKKRDDTREQVIAALREES